MYFNQDCFEILPTIADNSVDLIFCDLPYNSTNCKWDQSVIDLDKLWIEFKRIRKDTTPIVMTCTTKFGLELIKSNPKEFKFDMVWQKSRKCGFLQARKRPLCNHEMVYFFYKKQPKYNYLKYHKYSKKESSKALTGECYNQSGRKTPLDKGYGTYEPTLPASVIINNKGGDCYGALKSRVEGSYEPQLPASVIYDKTLDVKKGTDIYNKHLLKNRNVGYEPQLPASVIVNNEEKARPITVYGDGIKSSQWGTYEPTLPASVIGMNTGGKGIYKRLVNKNGEPQFKDIVPRVYDPPLPASVIVNEMCLRKENSTYGNSFKTTKSKEDHSQAYDPPLPASIQPFKSTKPSKHQTGKPLDLMEFILKYWTDEGDTVFDPTFGGGSMPIQCKIMNRKFIGCEMDKKFYDDTIQLLTKY